MSYFLGKFRMEKLYVSIQPELDECTDGEGRELITIGEENLPPL